jgi:hypothetical protein
MFRSTLLLLLLAAWPLAADEPVTIIPTGPTTESIISLRLDVWCGPVFEQRVFVNAGVIRVDLTPRPGTCPSPPTSTPYNLTIGRLPAGEYVVEVHIHQSTFTRRFIVRDAAAGEVEVHPFAVPSDPIGSRLRLVYPFGCAGENCKDVTVTVGGVPIPPGTIRGSNDGSIWFTPPPHAPGFADVVVTAYGQTFTTRKAIYYYDRSAPPDLSLWERVLFPVLFDSAGAHGSAWVSEAAIANSSRWFIENYNRIDAEPCIDYGCSELLAPGSFFSFGGSGHPNGIALLVSRAEADRLGFSLRIRDVARQAEGFGTEIPVVRESKMYSGTQMTLLDVPIDSRYRTKLRVYAFDSDNHGAFVQMHRGTVFLSYPVALSRSCSGTACAATPWYGELDLPSGPAGTRVNLYVSAGGPGSLSWAFASVTNNDTQQVTIVTPDGNGGRPEVQ